MVNLNLETLGIPPTVIGHLNERMPATKSWIVLCRFGSQKKKTSYQKRKAATTPVVEFVGEIQIPNRALLVRFLFGGSPQWIITPVSQL